MLWNLVVGHQAWEDTKLKYFECSILLSRSLLRLWAHMPVLFLSGQHFLFLRWFLPLHKIGQYKALMCHIERSGYILYNLTLHLPTTN